mgnify:CR=1 FL=1|jgi:indole-3-glycerol phosphate synthase
MDILKKITETKACEVSRQKKIMPEEKLKGRKLFNRSCNSMKSGLLSLNSSGIIAEFKQKSPSAGTINDRVLVEKVTRDYVNAGAAGISVLTDFEYFGGSLDDLVKTRIANPQTPLLRKDFIIDTYQLYESKANGADVILLIAACLNKEKAHTLAEEAKRLGMEVIMEIHDAGELDMLNTFVDIVGINNRNLKTFEVDIDTSVTLAGKVPGNYVKISESGLSNPENIKYLKKHGFKGFLIGETFMKTEDPGGSCKQFIAKLCKRE